MQKRCEGRVVCEVVTFDSDRCRFYPNNMLFPSAACVRCCCCLLSPACG